MSDLHKFALEIMALVDEFPSEPFTFERKTTEDKLETLLDKFLDMSQDSKDSWHQTGYDEGHYDATEETTNEYEGQIEELEDKVSELETELSETKSEVDQAFETGYETARQELGHKDN